MISSEEAAAAAAWAVECHKPERERQYRSCAEIANALARRPGRLELDSAECKRILHDLADCVRRGKFDASDVVILSGGNFVPLTPLLPSEILVTEEGALIRRHGGCGSGRFAIYLATISEVLFLRRLAVRQYIEESQLEGAARVMMEWFPEAAAPSDEAPISNRCGPQGRKAAATAAMIGAAEAIPASGEEPEAEVAELSDAGRIAPGSDADQRQPHPQPQQDAFRAWCERNYPNGITTDLSVKSLAAEYHQDTGLIVSPSSIRRALGRKQ